jgi:hypothetical protein
MGQPPSQDMSGLTDKNGQPIPKQSAGQDDEQKADSQHEGE